MAPMREMGTLLLRTEYTWNGEKAEPGEVARLSLSREGRHLKIDVEAPFHGDPPPPTEPGSTDGLWDYEVVELFLLGSSGAYFELELGPHGHYLALQLTARRQTIARGLPLRFRSQKEGRRWRGNAKLPLAYLPCGIERGNAYAMHGRGEERRYLAAYPGTAEKPDFHDLGSFAPLTLWGNP